MPLDESRSYTNDETYAVVADIVQLNGVIGGNDTVNAQTLPGVRSRTGWIHHVLPRGK